MPNERVEQTKSCQYFFVGQTHRATETETFPTTSLLSLNKDETGIVAHADEKSG